MKKRPRTSPLQEAPLRSPGQWLDEEINRIWDNRISASGLWIITFVSLISSSWIYYLNPPQTAPIIPTVLSLLVIGWNIRRVLMAKREIEKLKLGRDGERVVGQLLENLRAKGFSVLHDIQLQVGELKFNLDHVLLCEHGIYAIETKTLSKKVEASKILFDGTYIEVNGRRMKSNPIDQVQGAARRLKELLRESTGHNFPVRGIVVFPGWFVESKVPPSKTDVWVLNPKALDKFISSSKRRLKPDQVQMAVFHLSQYVRLVNT